MNSFLQKVGFHTAENEPSKVCCITPHFDFDWGPYAEPRYVKNTAPICIHFKAEIAQRLADDTHYRNQFETGTSNGKRCEKTRSEWEAVLFDRASAGLFV